MNVAAQLLWHYGTTCTSAHAFLQSSYVAHGPNLLSNGPLHTQTHTQTPPYALLGGKLARGTDEEDAILVWEDLTEIVAVLQPKLLA